MNRQEMINKLRDLADYNEEADNEKDAEVLRQIADELQVEVDPINKIVELNEERYGLSFNPTQAYSKLYEELEEFKEADLNNDNTEMLDALNDIIVIAVGEIRKMGYNPESTLNETIKEISSREQDPAQRHRWMSGGKHPGEKWLKNKSQDKSTLYKADFNKARIK